MFSYAFKTTKQPVPSAQRFKLGNGFLRHRQGISHQVLELLPVQGTGPILVAESKEPQIPKAHNGNAQRQLPKKTPRNKTRPIVKHSNDLFMTCSSRTV